LKFHDNWDPCNARNTTKIAYIQSYATHVAHSTHNAKSKTGLAKEIEHVLILCKQHKQWPMTLLDFATWRLVASLIMLI